MNLYQKYKENVIYYIYLHEDFYIKTYVVIKKNEKLYKIFLEQFNYIWQGDNIILKLLGRGYVPIEQILEEYKIEQIEDLEEQKIKKKINFIKKRK